MSLRSLLEENSIEKISVHDITDKIGVNRQTFYYYFHDIYDLIQWMLSEEVKKRFSKFDAKYIALSETLDVFYHSLNDNRKLIYAIYQSYDSRRSRLLIKDLIGPYCQKVLEVRPYYDRLDKDAKEFVLHMALAAVTSIITSWLDGEGDIEESKKIAFFVTIFDSSINEFITTCLDSGQKLSLK